MAPLLWRIEGACEEPNRAGWEKGVTLHVLFQPLTVIVARRDGQLRRYLALTGCPTCRPDGCDRVCHRILFEQLVHTMLPGITLISTPRLVPSTGETRRALATPQGVRTRPLDAALLEQWTEGRLITTLSRLQAKPQPACVGVLLAVGKDGSEPGQVLRAHNWNVRPLATRIYRAAFERQVPGGVPVAGRAAEALFHALCAPHVLAGGVSTSATAMLHDDDQAVAGQRSTLAEPSSTHPVEP